MSGPVRVALVGCGRISHTHFDAIRDIEGLELVAVCDAIEQRARDAGERNDVPWFTSYPRMLADVGCDAVAICTPSGLHPPHGILAASAGKHVICEKPMAISLKTADELVHACDSSGVHLFVVKQNRLNPAVQLLKRALDKGRFGRLYLANTTVRWTRPQEYYDQAPWRGTWEFDGGAFMNQASHYVDLIQWLVGPVESVVCEDGDARAPHRVRGHRGRRPQDSGQGHRVIEVTMLTYPRTSRAHSPSLARRARFGSAVPREPYRALERSPIPTMTTTSWRRPRRTHPACTGSGMPATIGTCWRFFAARRSPRLTAGKDGSRSN
jgi:UDP-N-acetyl-2-amino-2-deoxyglucuronate dehydrogenase